jgi:hypothetical protein
MHFGGDLVGTKRQRWKAGGWAKNERGGGCVWIGALTFDNYDCGRKFQYQRGFQRRTFP